MLAVGADLKNTCAVGRRPLRLAQPAHRRPGRPAPPWTRSTASERHLEELTGVQPERARRRRAPRLPVAPAGPATHAAGRPVRTVQHHHAHVASVMGEHGLGVDDAGHRGRLRRHRLRHRRRGLGRRGAGRRLQVASAAPPTSATCRSPAATPACCGPTGWRWRTCAPPGVAVGRRPAGRWRPARRPSAACSPTSSTPGFGCVPTSSMGRLFDAVASLVGVRHAGRLRGRGGDRARGRWPAASTPARRYAFALTTGDGGRSSPTRRRWSAPSSPTCARGVPAARGRGPLPRRASPTLVADLARPGARADRPRRRRARWRGVPERAAARRRPCGCCTERGFTVLRPRLLPPNDGGIALGQLLVGSAS